MIKYSTGQPQTEMAEHFEENIKGELAKARHRHQEPPAVGRNTNYSIVLIYTKSLMSACHLNLFRYSHHADAVTCMGETVWGPAFTSTLFTNNLLRRIDLTAGSFTS